MTGTFFVCTGVLVLKHVYNGYQLANSFKFCCLEFPMLTSFYPHAMWGM
jgi:hypothetical protein